MPATTAARVLLRLHPLMARLERFVPQEDTALGAQRWLPTARQGPTTQTQERPKRQTVAHAQKASTALAQATQLQPVPARLAIIVQRLLVPLVPARQLRLRLSLGIIRRQVPGRSSLVQRVTTIHTQLGQRAFPARLAGTALIPA